MYNTFNMGVGMCVAVAKEEADAALCAFRTAGESAFIMGHVVKGDDGVELC